MTSDPSNQEAAQQAGQEPEGFTFTDKRGRTWDLELSMDAAKRVDASDFSEISEIKFSLLRPGRELFSSILSDGPLQWAIIWAVVQPQVEANLGSDLAKDPEAAETEFLKGLNGPAIKQGREAFWRALADFFPEHGTALLTLIERLEKANQRIGLRISEMGQQMDEALAKKVDTELEEIKQEMDSLLT